MLLFMHELHVLYKAACVIPHRLHARLGKNRHSRAFVSAASSASAGEFSLDDSKRLCILILEKALKQLPKGQDTVLGVFDLKGFKQKNGDLGFAGFLVSMLTLFAVLESCGLQATACDDANWNLHVAVCN